MDKEPLILLLPQNNASFAEFVMLSKEIQRSARQMPLFLIHWQDSKEAIEVCKKLGFEYILYGISEHQQYPSEQLDVKDKNWPDNLLKKQLFSLKKKIVRFFPVQFVLYFRQFVRDKHFARKVFRNYRLDCILLIGDRHIGIETAIINLANNNGIPSLIVPFALSDKPSGVVYRKLQQNWKKTYGVDRSITRILKRMKPEWVYHQDGQMILWNPLAWMLAAQINGIMVKDPWSLGGGKAWKMAVESKRIMDNFQLEGIKVEKMIITGKQGMDESAAIWQDQSRYRKAIFEHFGFDKDDPLVVCSVPQMGEHDLLPWDDHWAETEFLFERLANSHPNLNVILSLHPKSEIQNYLPLAKKYGLRIADEHRYNQLIPVCDVFVATYSSTVTLAIACQIPTIVIDFYDFNYDLFDDVAGIEVVREHEQFMPTLEKLFNDQSYYNRLVDGQAEAAKIWARFDGRATERILNLINDLVEQGKEFQKLPKRDRQKALPPWAH